jgi:hypothetical protein
MSKHEMRKDKMTNAVIRCAEKRRDVTSEWYILKDNR